MANSEIIEKEIIPKGKCYVICLDLEGEGFLEVTNKLCKEAYTLGAEMIYYTCKDNDINMDFKEFETEDFTFELYTDMDILSKCIERPNSATEIELIGLSNDNRYEYMNYHNEAFFDVPNSMTIDDEEINLILEDSAVEAGLLYLNDEVIGTYHLDFSEENPEIASISINNHIQGKGYGILALNTLEEYLYYKGYKEVFLRVATLNENAYALYKKSGYKYLNRFSRWFLVRKKI